jgi:putative endonuclease
LTITSPLHFVYIVRCADGTLYTGYAGNPQERERIHNNGRGARYTSQRLPVSLVYSEPCESRSAALKREHQLKRWTRAQKEALVTKKGTRA